MSANRMRYGRLSFILASMMALIVLTLAWGSRVRAQSGIEEAAPALVTDVPVDVAVVVATTDTSQFDPPSPDPSGIDVVRGQRTLLIADSEVNEMPHLFTGANLFLTESDGRLLRTMSTLPHSDEPTGLAVNPRNGHIFVTDDTGIRGFYEIDPGLDGIFGSADDVATFINSELFGAMDPEGIAYDSMHNRLFLVDGADGPGTQAIFVIEPGTNGIFEGVTPDGDDVVSSFSALALGIRDPEGVSYNLENGHLYVLTGRDMLVAEMLPDGTLIRYIDVSATNGVNLAGLAYGPASQNPALRSLYIVDRGEDNSIDPEENDGVLYELSFPVNIANLPPFVDAGRDQVVRFHDVALLEGDVADDGMPDPPGMLTVEWHQVEGPGATTFFDETSLQATVSFSQAGSYLLRLTAFDGELAAWDEIVVVVQPPGLIHLPVFAHLTVSEE